MSRIPIRIRLTLFFAAAMAIVLAAVGLFVYLRVASDLDRAFDKDLRSRAQALSALVQRGGSVRPPGAPTRSRSSSRRTGGSSTRLRLLRGQPLLSPSQLALAAKEPRFFDRLADSGPGRVRPHARAAVQNDVLVVGATLEHRNDTLTSLQAAFLVGGPIALLLMSHRRLPARGRRAPADRVHAQARRRDLHVLSPRAAARPTCGRRGLAARPHAERDARAARGRARARAPLRRRREPRAEDSARHASGRARAGAAPFAYDAGVRELDPLRGRGDGPAVADRRRPAHPRARRAGHAARCAPSQPTSWTSWRRFATASARGPSSKGAR